MADTDEIKELKKRALEIKKLQKLKQVDQEWEAKGMIPSGGHHNARGLIEAEYAINEQLIDAGINSIDSSSQLVNEETQQNQTAPIHSTNTLRWEMFILDTTTGKGVLVEKHHQFYKNKPVYWCYLTLLKKRVEGTNDGEVTHEEFTQATGIKDKDTIKQVIRNLRKNLGINSRKNPEKDVFQATGNGYRLIAPLKV